MTRTRAVSYTHLDVYKRQGYFGLLETPDGYEKVELVIGEYFTFEDNGTIWGHYEIISGVSAGDILVVEVFDGKNVNEDLLKCCLLYTS